MKEDKLKKAFEPIVTEESKILILGTMPGERSLALQQYYGHPSNHFWKILFHLLGENFSTNYDERIQLLVKNKIALWDVLVTCERIGSADRNIKTAKANDFKSFFKTYPLIKKVYLDSGTAHKLYVKYVGEIEGIEYHALPSTSARYAAMSLQEKIRQWEIILDAIKH